ncbi:MAG TPA: invasion associated locus B family protein [Geminicoccus sp.]|jgi:invasion protein IalB|uniref:invasion associated locus B family protein n=1 Tax=Geminicoccus sp. TaxID=2024832 RepID=UPI002E301C5B|nr:invasion associated locus B family protein [Geminicoccus sp.]HEX2525019.1 invasion associated locus B family protein [Geminicoccus sp.]
MRSIFPSGSLRPSRKARAALAGLFLLVPALAGAADAPVAPPPSAKPDPAMLDQPSVTTATYGDWLVRCLPKAGGAPGERFCEVTQGIQLADRQGLIARLVLGRLEKDGPLRLVVQLPLGTWLPSGATLFLDAETKAGLAAPFTICLQDCLANVVVPDDLVDDLKTAPGPGRLEYVNGARKLVALPVSFKGLKAALEADAPG